MLPRNYSNRRVSNSSESFPIFNRCKAGRGETRRREEGKTSRKGVKRRSSGYAISPPWQLWHEPRGGGVFSHATGRGRMKLLKSPGPRKNARFRGGDLSPLADTSSDPVHAFSSAPQAHHLAQSCPRYFAKGISRETFLILPRAESREPLTV